MQPEGTKPQEILGCTMLSHDSIFFWGCFSLLLPFGISGNYVIAQDQGVQKLFAKIAELRKSSPLPRSNSSSKLGRGGWDDAREDLESQGKGKFKGPAIVEYDDDDDEDCEPTSCEKSSRKSTPKSSPTSSPKKAMKVVSEKKSPGKAAKVSEKQSPVKANKEKKSPAKDTKASEKKPTKVTKASEKKSPAKDTKASEKKSPVKTQASPVKPMKASPKKSPKKVIKTVSKKSPKGSKDSEGGVAIPSSSSGRDPKTKELHRANLEIMELMKKLE